MKTNQPRNLTLLKIAINYKYFLIITKLAKLPNMFYDKSHVIMEVTKKKSEDQPTKEPHSFNNYINNINKKITYFKISQTT